MAIESDAWIFSFTCGEYIPSKILEYFRGDDTRSELEVGSFCNDPVRLIKDDVFSDRFFLRVSKGGQILEFELAGERLMQLTEAIAQAVQELER